MVSKSHKRAARRRAATSRAEGANDNRGGHNKRTDVLRYPSGKINYYAMTEQPVTPKQAEKNRATAVAARMRHHGVSEKDAPGGLAGSVFGRMLLQREITQDQYDAGRSFEAAREGYRQAIQAPPPPRSGSDVSGVRGKDGSEGDDPAYVAACARARRRYADMRSAIMHSDAFGLMALEQVVCEDSPKVSERTMGSLRVACNAVSHMLKGGRGT